MIYKIIYFVICGSIIGYGENSLIQANNEEFPQQEKRFSSVECPLTEENEEIMALWQQIKKNQEERYWWLASGTSLQREELVSKENNNAIMRQFYYDFTDSALQTIQEQYASFSEAFPYVIADYNFLRAYREFLIMLNFYADCTQKDYELAVQAEAQPENPMRFLLKQQIQSIGGNVFDIITPSGAIHSTRIDNDGYFEILSCELPECVEQEILIELADWEARWKYGTELLKAFPPMTLYELKRNMSKSAKNSSVSFRPQRQNGRYLLEQRKRYCILENGMRVKSLIDYTRIIVEVTYLPKEKKYELKSEVLLASSPIASLTLTYDAETGKRVSDQSDPNMPWIMIMLDDSNLPIEAVTRGQCWKNREEDMRFELVAAGLSQGNLLALVKTIAMDAASNDYLDGNFLFDLNKGKFISANYHYLKTTEEQDLSIEVNIRSLDN